MALNSCVGAGEMLANSLGRNGLIIYPENVAGLVRTGDLSVPHSELAMHVGAAGKKLVAFGCGSDRWCGIVYEKDRETCGYTAGLPSEVMHQGLLRQVKNITGMDVAALGAAKRPRRLHGRGRR